MKVVRDNAILLHELFPTISLSLGTIMVVGLFAFFRIQGSIGLGNFPGIRDRALNFSRW